MTTPSPDDPAIRYGDRIQSRRASSARPAEQTDWSERNAIVEIVGDHVSHLAKEIGDHVADLETNLARKIKALELGLAQANGALDILKGKGLPGLPNPRGTYNSKMNYTRLDIVVRDSSSFVALRDKPGACPGDDWQMIACGGRRGPVGERGPAGPPGPTPTWTGATFNRNGWGIATRTGDAIPLLQSVNVDATDFSLKLVAPDGSTLRISLLPLFQAYNRQTTGG